MDASYFMAVGREALWVLALVTLPILLPALLAGLVLGMIQAATSINEATLTFVPKVAVVCIALVVFGSMMLELLSDFTVSIFERIPDLVR